MGTKTRVGQYGLIPEDVYFRKIEETQLYEDPDATESYQRQLLKNRTPDPYMFESDAPRINSESRQLLNLRYGGARTNIDPYLPDGTFLGFDHFYKDPRSLMTEPDFAKAKEQMYARGKLINFYPDNDDSVMGGWINPLEMQENITQSIPRLKNYMKIFETSFDSRSTKAWMPQFTGHCQDIATVDHQIADLNAATCVNRSKADATTRLSNETQIGWWQDIDTRFNVSKYGQIRPEAPFSKNWHKTMRESKPDQMLAASYEGAPIGRDLALFMINFVHRKEMLHDTAQNVLFGKGLMNTNSARRMTKEDISHLIERSAARQAHANYEDARVGRPAVIPRVDLAVGSKVWINPAIVDFLNEAVHLDRKNPKRQMADLRNDILQTAIDTGIYQTAANRQIGQLPDAHLGSTAVHESAARLPEGRAIQNYIGLKPPKLSESRNNAQYESYKSTSATRANQCSRETYERQTTADYHADMDHPELEGLTKERVARGLGTKNLRGAMQFENRGDYENDESEGMNTIEARN